MSDYAHMIIHHTPLSPYTKHLCLDSQQLHPFYSLPQLHHVTASAPIQARIHQRVEWRFKRTQDQAKMACQTKSSTHTPGLSTPSYLSCMSRSFHRLPLLPKATFAPSIQPNIVLPHTRSTRLTSSFNTLLAIRYSSILSTCQNHLNTL